MTVMDYAGPWRPRFVYGIGDTTVDWALSLPVMPWERRTATAGGSRTAASGTPAAHVVRRDHNLELTLRLFESEMASLNGLMVWAQAAENFLWYPDATDDTQSFLVWLESPKAGEDVVPMRSSEYPRVLEVRIELRPTAPLPWTLDYFPEC